MANRPEVIEWLSDRIFETLAEAAEEREFNTGEVMNALFSIVAQSAQNSPDYDPKTFAKETADAVRIVVGLQ